MSATPTPPPIEALGNRPFSFYPPILGIEHNEWSYVRATWSEMVVANRKSGLEVWIPRQYLGEMSRVDEPVMIVGLTRELEYKAGAVWPYERRVIEMPKAVGQSLADPNAPFSPMPRAPRDRGNGPESRIGRLIVVVVLLGILACFVVVSVLRINPLRPKVVYTARDQSFLELSRDDSYVVVARKLGRPAEDRWRADSGELQFRILVFPERGYSAVLMGPDKDSARYIGCVDKNWHVVHSVDSPRGGSTLPLLRNLKPF